MCCWGGLPLSAYFVRKNSLFEVANLAYLVIIVWYNWLAAKDQKVLANHIGWWCGDVMKKFKTDFFRTKNSLSGNPPLIYVDGCSIAFIQVSLTRQKKSRSGVSYESFVNNKSVWLAIRWNKIIEISRLMFSLSFFLKVFRKWILLPAFMAFMLC